MKIINNPCLPYKLIGEWMDQIISQDYQDTCYYGKIDNYIVDYKKKRYRVQIRYLKSYVEWRFDCCENN